MYGKVFECMYDGSLSADWKAMIVFQQFIVLADCEGIVDYTPQALNRRTGIPLDIIEHGIEVLQRPDPFSRLTDFEGRRIALLDDDRPWGWSIVSYKYYRDLASREDQRVKARERKRKQRGRQSQPLDNKDVSQDVTPGHAASRMSRHEDEDENEFHSPSESAQEADSVIWNTGIELLGGKKGDRSLIGKWVSVHGKEKVAATIAQAAVQRPVEAKAYITAALQERSSSDPYYNEIRQAVANANN